MPGPVVYVVAVIGVVAVGIAFHELIYEPHLAPKVAVIKEQIAERRRQRRRQQQGPVSPHTSVYDSDGDDHPGGRNTDAPTKRPQPDEAAIELEQLVAKEQDAWRQDRNTLGLRHRNVPGSGGSHESRNALPSDDVIFTTSSAQTSRGARSPSIGSLSPTSSAMQSVLNSPTPGKHSRTPSNAPIAPSPRLPTPTSKSPVSSRADTPMSAFSLGSSRAISPTSTLSGSDISRRSSRVVSPARSAAASAYNTPLDRSFVVHPASPSPSTPQRHPLQDATPAQSPFSDFHAVQAADARQDDDDALFHSFVASPRANVGSPVMSSVVDLMSDDEFDILSPRSGMFSPPSRVGADLFEVGSEAGSDASSEWADVRHRSPLRR